MNRHRPHILIIKFYKLRSTKSWIHGQHLIMSTRILNKFLGKILINIFLNVKVLLNN